MACSLKFPLVHYDRPEVKSLQKNLEDAPGDSVMMANLKIRQVSRWESLGIHNYVEACNLETPADLQDLLNYKPGGFQVRNLLTK